MKVGLVLGGGGARGYAHIGVLKALEEANIEVIALAGCSMGGIVGAAYAAGKSAQEMIDLIENSSFMSFLDIGNFGGLIGNKGIRKFLKSVLPETFEDLAIPLSVTTVDVQAGRLMVLRKGSLIDALLATSALPGFLSPTYYEGVMCIDGGVLNNLPVDIIRTMTLEAVIAVDVAAPPNRQLEFEADKNKSSMASFSEKAMKLFSGKGLELLKRNLTMELFMKSFDIPQKILTDMRLSLQPPELLIRPNLRKDLGVEDFLCLDEGVEAGYEATKEALKHWALYHEQQKIDEAKTKALSETPKPVTKESGLLEQLLEAPKALSAKLLASDKESKSKESKSKESKNPEANSIKESQKEE